MAARLTTYIVTSVVALTMIAGIIAGAQRDDAGPVDLVVLNGKVYSADGSGTFAEAVAVRGNHVVKVGANREIKAMARPQTTVIDAHGGAVVPGFNDAHVHFANGSLALTQLNLLDVTTLQEVAQRITAYAAQTPGNGWLLGRGWFYTVFPGGTPTKEQLDAIVADRPVYLVAYDGHSGWANSAALKAAGITRATANPVNGNIVKDAKGEPTGMLQESAMGLMEAALPKPTREERVKALEAGVQHALSFGVTSVQNANGTAEEIELYDDLRKADALKVRMYHAVSGGPGLTEADVDGWEAIRKRYPDDPLFKAGIVKLMVDGVIEAHTGAMLAPYANRPETKGHPNFTPEDLTRIVTMLDRRGWQIQIHAIGDAGIRMSLDAFEAAAKANPAPARGRRHRIEHIESIDPADIPRFAKLNVIASMQPLHANPDPGFITVWRENIGPERASHAWLWGSIAAAGGRVAFGSDWPVVSIDPRLGLQVAANRMSPKGGPAGGWLPKERMKLTAVIDAYTRGSAYASFDEGRKGTLAPGMLADIVVLSTDIFSHPSEKVMDAKVDVTIFDGKVVYTRTKPATN